MISLSLKKISSITEGILHGSNIIINDIMINSKKIIPGSLFIALIGNKFDAHIFIKEAIKNGCVAIITQKRIHYPISYIIVKNTSIALGRIASWIRIFLNTKVIAITGSAGKTSVKDMTTSILQINKKIISTINNNNNSIGVPITLLRLKKEHKYAIIELGANTPGEILYTSHISKPNIILINNIYHAHLAGFKSLLGVSKAKEEIFYGLQKNGIVILNLDSHHFSQWRKKIKNKKTIFFSIKKKKNSHFFTSNININIHNTSFVLHTPDGTIKISLPFLGYHNISNALASSAIAFSLNIPLEIIKKGLSNASITSGRLEIIQLSSKKILINDTYNSNVASMISAIKVLEKMPGYKILITGDMSELGKKSHLYHKVIGNTLRMTEINKVLSIGQFSVEISKYSHNGEHYAHLLELKKRLKKIILNQRPITILVKGSRSTRMEKIVEYIIQEDKKNALLV